MKKIESWPQANVTKESDSKSIIQWNLKIILSHDALWSDSRDNIKQLDVKKLKLVHSDSEYVWLKKRNEGKTINYLSYLNFY